MRDGQTFGIDWEGPDPSEDGPPAKWRRTWVLSIEGDSIAERRFQVRTTREGLIDWLKSCPIDEAMAEALGNGVELPEE